MAEDTHNPLSLEIEVLGNDNLTKSLAKSEAAYIKAEKAIHKTVAALKDESNESKETAKNKRKETKSREDEHTKVTGWARVKAALFGKHSKKEEDDVKKRGGLSKFITGFYHREKEAADEAGISFSSIAGLIGGGAILGAVYKSAEAFLEWDNSLGEIRTTLSTVPGVMTDAGMGIRELAADTGISREAIIEATKAIGDLNLSGSRLDVTSEEFQTLRKEIVEFGSAMGMSSDSVGELYHDLHSLYNLPHQRIRELSRSMKYLQENTSMTGQEVASFVENMKDLTARVVGDPDKRADAIRDFSAIAASLKDQGVDAKNFPSLFEEALKIDSEQGRTWLAFIEGQTGVGMDKIKNMIKSGDMTTPMELFVKATKTLAPEAIEQFEPLFKTMGLGAPEILRLRNVNETSLRDMVNRAKAAEHDQSIIQRAAEARQNKLTQSWARIKLIAEDLWLSLGQAVTEGLVKHLQWFTTPEGKEATAGWIEKARLLGGALVDTFMGLVGWIKQGVEWWNNLSDSNKNLLVRVGEAIVIFKVLSGVINGIGGNAMALVAGLTAIYIGAKKIADWIDERQGKDLKAQAEAGSAAEDINRARGFKSIAGGGFEKVTRSKETELGDIKALIDRGANNRLLTSSGEINKGEMEKRLGNISDDDEKNRLRKNWTDELEKVRSSPLFKEALEQRAKEMQQLKAISSAGAGAVVSATANEMATTAGLPGASPTLEAATPVATTPIPTVSGETKSPQVTVIQNPQSTDRWLQKIYEAINGINAAPGAPPSHPSRQALAEALGR